MEGATLEKLSDLAKKKCRITWSDENTENTVRDMVENAVEALPHRLGMTNAEPEDFLEPGMTRTLFETYCLYDWNNALEEFETNYSREILAERHKHEVKRYAETKTE